MCACIGAPSFVFVPLKGGFEVWGKWCLDGWLAKLWSSRASIIRQAAVQLAERERSKTWRDKSWKGIWGDFLGWWIEKGLFGWTKNTFCFILTFFFSFVCCSWMSSRLWCSYYGFNFPLCVCTNRFAPFEQHTESILKVFSFSPRKSSHFVGIFVPGGIHRNSLGFKQNVVLFRK